MPEEEEQKQQSSPHIPILSSEKDETSPDELAYSTLAAMTRRDYKCKHCNEIFEDLYHISDPGHQHCPHCNSLMSRYFGNTFGIRVNYGFRPARYLNKDDERIAQYQFENL